ncbi:MAG: hypothetical protein ACT4OF_01340, partial [Caulobacteraceae bacterium]
LEESNQVARRRPGARANYDYYQQRWFIGTHGDIGGGDGSPLAAATLQWIADGATKQGLRFYAKHGADVSPMEEEIARAGADVHRAPISRPKLLEALKLQNWSGPARKVWGDRNKRPRAEDVVLYLDDTVVRRACDEAMRPRYKPASLKPFRDALKDLAKKERNAEREAERVH